MRVTVLGCMAWALGLGLVIGVAIGGYPRPRAPKPAPIIAPDTEARIDRSTCEALVIGAIVHERMRLTGKPNPPAVVYGTAGGVDVAIPLTKPDRGVFGRLREDRK